MYRSLEGFIEETEKGDRMQFPTQLRRTDAELPDPWHSRADFRQQTGGLLRTKGSPAGRTALIWRLAGNTYYDEFCKSVRVLFGYEVRSQDLKSVFKKFNSNPEAPLDWSELFGHYEISDENASSEPDEENTVFLISKRKIIARATGDKKRRDQIHSVVKVSDLDLVVTASQKGQISIYNNKMLLHTRTNIPEALWVTGCDYLANLKRVVIVMDRSIGIWDYRQQKQCQANLFTIKPLDNPLLCVCTVTPSEHLLSDSILIGDNAGFVNLVTISNSDLSSKKSEEKGQAQTLNHIGLRHPVVRRKLHNDWVLKVAFFPELNAFGSCSLDSDHSFVLEELQRLEDNQEVREISVPRGVNTFAYCVKANLIATGGSDKIIRVWHPTMFSKPMGKLFGHLFTITHIAANEKDQHIISLCSARIFRVWDIQTLTPLQVFTDNQQGEKDSRIHAMVFDGNLGQLITGSGVLDVWPLQRTVQDTVQLPITHNMAVNVLVYNTALKQALTICSKSLVKVWELETGDQVYQIANAHGPHVELTAAAVDSAGFHLVTGGVDGSLKVWDFESGQDLKWKAPEAEHKEGDQSLVKLVYLSSGDERSILTLHGNGAIQILQVLYVACFDFFAFKYKDSDRFSDLKLVQVFPTVQCGLQIDSLLQSPAKISALCTQPLNQPLPDIGCSPRVSPLSAGELTCLDVLYQDGNHLVVTGSTNGTIVLWDYDSATVKHLYTEDQILHPADQQTWHYNFDRVNAVLFLVCKRTKLSSEMHNKQCENAAKMMETDWLANWLINFSIELIEAAQSSWLQEQVMRGNLYLASRQGRLVEWKRNESYRVVQEDVADGDITLNEKTKVNCTPEQNDAGSLSAQQTDEMQPDGIDVGDTEFNTCASASIKKPCVFVSAHQNCDIYFWNTEGQFMKKVLPATRGSIVPLTAMCVNLDADLLLASNQKGYIILWDIIEVSKRNQEVVRQRLSWRAHSSPVTSIFYVDSQSVVLSASTDGSVRVWYAPKGHYIGYFGQHRVWQLRKPLEFTLPCDVSQHPLEVKTRGKSLVKKKQQEYVYPLILNWERPVYKKKQQISKPQVADKDVKFFKHLALPKLHSLKKSNLEMYTSGDGEAGGIFKSLPVYRIRSPAQVLPIPYLFVESSQDSKQSLSTGKTKCPKEMRRATVCIPTKYSARSGNKLRICLSEKPGAPDTHL
ncbi:WD repeat-containing protein 64-like [Acipenser ruthenus]|uniref:WD repeat-containing protein 64-like n=1 Tax=Acipenser ruthenus TaxID=7906 RepID=UPI002742468A|nr:WD repeat-containing protein 64-like [Acipenser ruthenus]